MQDEPVSEPTPGPRKRSRGSPPRGDVGSRSLLVGLTLPLLALVLSIRPAVGQEAGEAHDAARVDSVFAAFDDTRSPGCAVGVRRGGETVLARGYGMADLEHGVPIGPESVFRIGSVSKQFTAAAILILAGDGTLSLDDPVRRWVPELPEDPYAGVTVRHLLHHTSGVRDYLTLMTLSGRREKDYYTDRQVLATLARQEGLNFRPGSDYLYSNAGYFLLGKIVEAASGRSLPAFAADRIFGPLGMEHSHFHDRPDHLVPRRAVGHEPREEGGYRRSVTALPMVGDGGVYTSVRDFFRWMENLADPSVDGPVSAERMTRRGVLASGDTIDYAMGIRVDRHRGLRRVSHGGSFVGYRAGMALYPAQGFGAVALCNRSDAEPMEKLSSVAEIYLGSEMTEEDEEEERTGGAESEAGTDEGGWSPGTGALERYVGRYASRELDAVYRVRVEDGRLELAVGNRLDGELVPVEPGVFERSFLTLRFGGGDGGPASGFELDAGRVRGIAFERVPSDAAPEEGR